jgi:hypothetical protein
MNVQQRDRSHQPNLRAARQSYDYGLLILSGPPQPTLCPVLPHCDRCLVIKRWQRCARLERVIAARPRAMTMFHIKRRRSSWFLVMAQAIHGPSLPNQSPERGDAISGRQTVRAPAMEVSPRPDAVEMGGGKPTITTHVRRSTARPGSD